MSERERKDVLVTTEGLELKLRPVSQILLQQAMQSIEKRLRSEGWRLDPPTYEVRTVDGHTEVHQHNESTLSSDEDKAAWAEYQAASARLQREVQERTMKLTLCLGIVASDPPEGWAEELRWLGVDVPDDPRELKFFYISTELLKTPEDLLQAFLKITQLSMAGAPKEMVEAVETLFRRAVEGEATGESASEERPLDV